MPGWYGRAGRAVGAVLPYARRRGTGEGPAGVGREGRATRVTGVPDYPCRWMRGAPVTDIISEYKDVDAVMKRRLFLGPPKVRLGDPLGDQEPADEGAVGVEAVHPVVQGGRPQPAVVVEADVVEVDTILCFRERLLLREGAVVADIEDADAGGAGVGDVQPPFVGREDDALFGPSKPSAATRTSPVPGSRR